jgi:hypothetical protein
MQMQRSDTRWYPSGRAAAMLLLLGAGGAVIMAGINSLISKIRKDK